MFGKRRYYLISACLLVSCTLFICLEGCVNTGTFSERKTVDDAKAAFDNGTFKTGATTQDDVKAEFGSPNTIKKVEAGGEKWVYIKTETENVGSFGLGLFGTTDVASGHFSAVYTFDKEGVLTETSYSAKNISADALR